MSPLKSFRGPKWDVYYTTGNTYLQVSSYHNVPHQYSCLSIISYTNLDVGGHEWDYLYVNILRIDQKLLLLLLLESHELICIIILSPAELRYKSDVI